MKIVGYLGPVGKWVFGILYFPGGFIATIILSAINERFYGMAVLYFISLISWFIGGLMGHHAGVMEKYETDND